MLWIYFLILFIITFVSASIPFIAKWYKASWQVLLLAFSGSFLFSISAIHLMPETFHELGHQAGMFIILGFFLQLLLQKFSHGAEHGHIHEHDTHGHQPIGMILIGLGIHAFMEGIPLGFNYQHEGTSPSLFLGVMAHKIPEALTLAAFILSARSISNKWFLIFFFALISPLAGILAMVYGQKFYFISSLLTYIVPIVIGSFLHISTTILYESGTKKHELSKQKIVAILLGVLFALCTYWLNEHTHMVH
ncbi:MAG: ZIP family metal transporter [Chitinophagaceae bacterium]